MAHLALYRSWRPQTFTEVVGQDYIVTALQQAVVSQEIAHALLFTGTRGTGKTSLAKIFARAINCQDPQEGNPCNACAVCTGALDGSLLDIMEIDAASNNSVDNIRQITDEVNFAPTLARYKVYIIDEVHMLSTSAFNALLKTLEEPPSHAVFILATTDPQRIPATILSRCQRYDFKRIGDRDMMARLRTIADAESIAIDDEALLTICQLADGALRDAISLLDQTSAASSGTIGRKEVQDLVGMVDDHFMGQIIAALIRGDAGTLLGLIHEMLLEGDDVYRFALDLTQYYRNILVTQSTKRPEAILRLPRQTMAGLKQLGRAYTQKQVVQIIQFLGKTLRDLKQASNPRINLEVSLIELLNLTRVPDELVSAPKQEEEAEATHVPEQQEPTVTVAPAPARREQEAEVTRAEQPKPDVQPDPGMKVELEEEGKADTAQVEEQPPKQEPTESLDEEPVAPTVEPADLTDDFAIPASQEEIVERPEEPAPAVAEEVEAAPVEASEPAPASQGQAIDPPSLEPFLNQLGQALITQFSNAEAAILIRSAKASWQGKDLRLDFAPEQERLYNVLMRPELRRVINQALTALAPDQEPELVLHLQEAGERLPDGTIDQTPEWIKKVKMASDTLGIPLEISE